jgi:hypothetical protein
VADVLGYAAMGSPIVTFVQTNPQVAKQATSRRAATRRHAFAHFGPDEV